MFVSRKKYLELCKNYIDAVNENTVLKNDVSKIYSYVIGRLKEIDDQGRRVSDLEQVSARLINTVSGSDIASLDRDIESEFFQEDTKESNDEQESKGKKKKIIH